MPVGHESLILLNRPLVDHRVFDRFDRRKWLKVGEAMLVAAVSAVVFMILIFAVPDCKPIRGFDTTPERHHVNTTGHLLPGNSTIGDVIYADDVTWDPTANVSEHEHQNEDHAGHGDVFQVGNTLDLQMCGDRFMSPFHCSCDSVQFVLIICARLARLLR